MSLTDDIRDLENARTAILAALQQEIDKDEPDMGEIDHLNNQLQDTEYHLEQAEIDQCLCDPSSPAENRLGR